MFGAKPDVGSKPIPAVLKRFQEKAEEAGQTSFKPSYGSSVAKNKPGDSTPAKENGGVTKTALKPKPISPPVVPGKSSTDQNQNITNSSMPKKGSINIPGKFQSPGVGSKEKKISIEEKPSAQNGGVPKPASPVVTTSATKNDNNNEQGKFDFRANLKSASRTPGTPKKVDINPRQRTPSDAEKITPPPASPNKSGTPGKTGLTSPPVKGNKTATTPFSASSGMTSPPVKGNKTATTPFSASSGTTSPTVVENKTETNENKSEDKPSAVNVKQFRGKFVSSPDKKSERVPSFNKRITPLKAIVTRSDGRKFERLAKSTIITTELAPIKPLKLKNQNVKDIIEEYKKAFEEFKYSNEELYDDVGNFIQPEEEYYDDVGNTVDRRTSARLSKRPVSEIPVWTEEEEMGSGGSLQISGGSHGGISQPAEELYDDGGAIPEESDELYEPLPEEPEEDNLVVDKREQERLEKEAAERRKKDEEERKKREKKEKQEQAKREKEEKARQEKERKEREKREKEERDLRKKLKLIGDEVVEACGVVKEKQKGGKLDLAVVAGQSVEIIRMTDNPKGKWLIRDDEGHYGYVESSNITIDTSTIRQQTEELAHNLQAMKIVDTPHDGDFGQEEMYEDLDGYQQDEEIYEECS